MSRLTRILSMHWPECYLLLALHVLEYLQVRHVIKRRIPSMITHRRLFHVYEWRVPVEFKLVVLLPLYKTVLRPLKYTVRIRPETTGPVGPAKRLFSRQCSCPFLFLIRIFTWNVLDCRWESFGTGIDINFTVNDVGSHFLQHFLNVLIFHGLFMNELVLKFGVPVNNLDLKEVPFLLVFHQIILHRNGQLLFGFRQVSRQRF